MNKFSTLLYLTLVFVSNVFAQTNSYTLDNVVQQARSSSTAWLSAETRKENQYWQYKTHQSDYKPRLDLTGKLPFYNKGVDPIVQDGGNTIYTETNNNLLGLGLDLSQAISATGGKIFVSTDLNRYDDFILDYSQYTATPIYVGLGQPIFQFNQLKWNKKIKPLEYEESQRKYFEELEQISVTATRRFFDLMLAQINLEIASKNVESNDTIFQIAQGRYNLGKITENALLQLELNLVNSNLSVKQALVDQESASLYLKSFIGMSGKENFQLILPILIPEFIVDEKFALEKAIENKADIVSFERRKMEAEELVERAKKNNGMNMNLTASFGFTGVTSENKPVGEVYQNNSNTLRVGLNMNVPVLDWGRQKAYLKTAQAESKLIEYSLIQDKITFEEDVLTQARNFNMLRDQLDARIKSDKIAQKAYNISKQLFLIGKISITDLNAALAAKDRAKQNYVSSLRDYWVAYYQLREKTLYDFHHNQLLVRDIQNN